jgi:hypothetical protein
METFYIKGLCRSEQISNIWTVFPISITSSHLCKLEMPVLHILQIKNFLQNILLSSTMIEEVHCLFNMAQVIGVEMVEWIAEAKKHCRLLGRSHGWNWNGKD